MKRNIVLAVLLFFVLSIGACSLFAKDISEIKSDEYVGEEVRVRGEVKASVKIGALSGFTLEDDTGSIAVSSESIPKEGDIITVTGILKENPIVGYYIDRKE